MALNKTNPNNVAYGIYNPLQNLAPQPIVSRRAPTTSDKAELGSVWVNEVSGVAYILAQITAANGALWTTANTGGGTFTSVDVNPGDITVDAGDINVTLGDLNLAAGNAIIAGDLTVSGDSTFNGDVDITSASAIQLTSTANQAQAMYLLANGGTSETVEIRAEQGTGAASVQLLSDAGGITLTSGLNTTVAATGAVAIDSSGSTIGIGSAANTGAINIGTGAAARTITIGNATGATSLVLNAGTGAVNIGSNAVAHTTTVGSLTGAAATTVQSGSGALNVTATNGALTVNSGTGALGVSTDASATTVSIATGGAIKTTTLGSTNSTSSTTVQSGSGALNVTSTNGALTINSGTGALAISNNAGATTVSIATGAAAKTTTLGSTNTTSTTTIQAGTGGLALNAAGLVSVLPVNVTAAGDTVVNNVRVGQATYTGITTASAAKQVLVLTNSLITANSAILVSAANFGSNDAQMTVTRVVPGTGTCSITVTNNGAAALNGNIVLSFWILS